MITTKKEIKLLDFSSINMDIDFSRLKNELQLYKKKYLIYSIDFFNFRAIIIMSKGS